MDPTLYICTLGQLQPVRGFRFNVQSQGSEFQPDWHLEAYVNGRIYDIYERVHGPAGLS